jgi:hypothetical protein
MRKYLVVVVLVLVAGAWVAGFAPEYSARHEAEAARDELLQQLDAAQAGTRVGDLLGQCLALEDLAREGRFVEAQPLSSAFFDEVRAESQRTADPALRDSLVAVLSERDPVTAALTRGESGVAERIRAIGKRLRRRLGYTVPGGAPATEAAAADAVPTPAPDDAEEADDEESTPEPPPEGGLDPTPTPDPSDSGS